MSPTGGTVVLRAAGALTRDGAPAGEAAGIEVPVDDQRSYVFEYRRQAATTVGDKHLDRLTGEPGLALVLGTDVTPSTESPKRPPILLLPVDGDGDGPVLDVAGDDFEDSDVTDKLRMWDFRVSLDSIDAADPNRARVTVHYVGAHRPQLMLHPAPGGTDFKSRDIALRNPFGEEFVVPGSPHTIRLTIHNTGTLAATDVITHVQWLPFTTAPGSWNPLPEPEEIALIPAKDKVTIEIPWTPPNMKLKGVPVEHFCVNARIDRFRNPLNPDEDEIVVADNWAQSNFTTESVANGSPSDRVRTVMGFENTLERESTHFFGIRQTRNVFRVYVGHAWLALPAGGSAAIPLAYESLAGDPQLGSMMERLEPPLVETPAQVAITSWLQPPSENECPTPRERFGAGIAFCLVVVVMFGLAFPEDSGGELADIAELAAIFAHPLVGMVLLAAHRARSRSVRDGTQELLDACPTSQSTSTHEDSTHAPCTHVSSTWQRNSPVPHLGTQRPFTHSSLGGQRSPSSVSPLQSSSMPLHTSSPGFRAGRHSLSPSALAQSVRPAAQMPGLPVSQGSPEPVQTSPVNMKTKSLKSPSFPPAFQLVGVMGRSSKAT